MSAAFYAINVVTLEVKALIQTVFWSFREWNSTLISNVDVYIANIQKVTAGM